MISTSAKHPHFLSLKLLCQFQQPSHSPHLNFPLIFSRNSDLLHLSFSLLYLQHLQHSESTREYMER